MAEVKVSLDAKHPEKFLIETSADVSLFGWETKSKYESYYMEISPWNLIDLFQQAPKLGLQIEYDPIVQSIREGLLFELNNIKDAQKFKKLPIDEINYYWAEGDFDDLFPKFTPDDHQKRMILWMLQMRKSGCFMEQGLGKTPVGIVFLGKLMHDGLIKNPLVLAPVSLLDESAWFGDMQKFSDFKIINLRDPNQMFDIADSKTISFVNPEKLQGWCYKKTSKADKSYDKDNFFEQMKFDGIFFDESSMLKNPTSYRTKTFLNICKYAKYMGFASGTPAPNQIFQIWATMKAIGSVLGDNYNAFEARYGVKRKVGPAGEKYFATSAGEMQIRKRIDLVSYFIPKNTVMNLPARIMIDVPVDLHEDHQKLYDKIQKDYIAALQGFNEDGELIEGKAMVEHEVAVRMKLLQILNGFVNLEDKEGKFHKVSLQWNAKMDKLKELIEEILKDDSNNVIIWCRFRWEVETIYQLYKDIATFIYGGMSDKKRRTNLLRWLKDPSCRIMISNPKSTKFGHTWNKANYTIYYSGTEDYEDFSQSRDRNYRRGQTREVTEYKLITRKTIEKQIWQCIQMRKKLDVFLKTYLLS